MTTTMRTTRTRITRAGMRTAVAALGATLALATLTGCQDDELDAGAGAETPVETPTESPEGSAEGSSDETAEEPAGEDGSAGAEGSGAEPVEDIEPCTDATTEVTVTPVERPINHLLLTATNTGDATCFAYGAPYLRFGEAQAPVARYEDSAPQSVVALDPGEVAYAGIMTSSAAGEAGEGWTVDNLGVQFAGAEDEGVGGMVDVPLPEGEWYVDNAALVTYWNTSLDAVL
ncbi:DUF4232 domain-containing protein [Streptomyces sp. 3MP-14]|uniref:DUF4232 domain-containing protein n=1 Tax=Streptomyces mimosae TaxID=2586635 RepID=A0A5N6A710_9ACTN|nr:MULTISPECIES: DUF4232 domain-containing protein [Streptomyces]KAB8163719.1 DUF4232 domain-containing protein [Streptomyces mimosae]KAB8175162.1 DUF4232 domain-containing protein [Streptomyces sp. 3MP-14]